jgi:predicted nucleic acid-binding protein
LKIFDTGILIASLRPDDEHHNRAIIELDNSKIVITDTVFSETVEFLRRKYGSQEAAKAGRWMLDSDIEVIQTDMTQKTRAVEIVAKYPGLSFYDALTVAVLEGFEEKIIVSFDSDFDLVKGITRIGN